ncbi:MAG: UDP-N-acetylmuramoyl-L-alanine--D-glutamate ligase, partial [Cyanobacteria bacterium J06600_6]
TLVDSATESQIASRSNAAELQSSQQQLKQEGVKVKLNSRILETDTPELIIVSPGVPWDIEALEKARQQKIATIGEIELAWRYLQQIPWVGITGTNGKTTTTALVAAIFQNAGLNAPACGNIGNAACELALQSFQAQDKNFDWIVAELSSYQIESSPELAPQIGIFTTLTPDHLSRHYTLDNYFQIKASLIRRCKHKIINGDDRFLQTAALDLGSDLIWTSVKGKSVAGNLREVQVYIESDWIIAFGDRITPVSSFKMPGEHNLQNLLVAVAAAKLAGVNKDKIAEAIANFSGVKHRLEYIRTYEEIKFINDSKATNYDAAEVGLNSVAAPAILIAGGKGKEGDDTAWIDSIKANAVFVLLIGEAAPVFAQKLSDRNYHNYKIVETMENAVTQSVPLAQQYQAKTILLSPACASFDQYLSFEARGEHFRQLCQELS